MNLDLRPLSIPELLDRSVSLYRRHLVLFVGIMAIPAALSLIFLLPLDVATHFMPTQGEDGVPSLADIATVLVVFGGFVLGMVLYFVVYVLALGATSFAVSDLYQNGAPSIDGSYGRVRPHALALVWLWLNIGVRLVLAMGGLIAVGAAVTALLVGVVGPFAVLFTFAGGVAGFVLFVMLSLRYSLSVPALVLEGLTARAAIARSITLSRGNLGRAFLIIFCATMITYAGALLFQGPFMIGSMLVGQASTLSLVLTLLGTIFGTIGGALVAPVMIIGLVVLYFDARVRAEALDVQVMMAAVARADQAAGSGGLVPSSTAQ